MSRTLIRRSWLGLLGLACFLPTSAAHGWGQPIPIATDSAADFHLNIKIGAAAFARPAGPWYSYFPVDPYLLAQPRASAFPNWPPMYPPPGAAPVPPIPPVGPVGPGPRPPVPGMTYYPPASGMPYGYGASVYPVGYYAPPSMPGYWYYR
jgi:hypothetical protein